MGKTTSGSPVESHRHHRHTASQQASGFRLGSFTSSGSVIISLLVLLIGFLAIRHPGTLRLAHSSSPSSHTTHHTEKSIPSTDKRQSVTSPTMASIRRTSPIVFPAVGRHTATVIFAHGLGDSGHGWASAVELWRRRQRLDEVKFILPHAPAIPITVNGGFQMPGWFDIITLGGSVEELRQKAASEDGPGILLSREYFNSLVQAEISAGIPSERIVLGGFSQGGAMSILTGVTSPVKLGGIIGLSSWLLLSQSIKEHIPKENLNKDTPIFMGHGDQDPVVRYELAVESQRILKDLGYNAQLETYRGMAHSACQEELDEVEKYLVERLPKAGSN